ncbi:MAG: MurT ligase domain-containing protein [Bacilli bacterium]
MKKIRFYFTYIFIKCLYLFMKLLHKGATQTPGRIAIALCPDFLEHIKKPKLIIGITGTNGKTTTTNLIVDTLETLGVSVLNNKRGSNSASGIASSLIGNFSKKDIAVFEVDERSTIRIFPFMKFDYLVSTNITRDTIMRNAHPKYIVDIINSTLREDTTLIINSDDFFSCLLGKENNTKIYYSVGPQEDDKKKIDNIIKDAVYCPKCGGKLEFSNIKYLYIGKYKCNKCGYENPICKFVTKSIDKNKRILTLNNKEYPLIDDGIFNIYNETAAISILLTLGYKEKAIASSLLKQKLPSIRYRSDTVDNITLYRVLAKSQSPTAVSTLFDRVKKDPGTKEVILAYDDIHMVKHGSENMSWLYDTDFEFLKDKNIKRIIIGGPRSLDNHLRLLMTGIDPNKLILADDEYDVKNKLKFDCDNIYLMHDMYNEVMAGVIYEEILEMMKERKN